MVSKSIDSKVENFYKHRQDWLWNTAEKKVCGGIQYEPAGTNVGPKIMGGNSKSDFCDWCPEKPLPGPRLLKAKRFDMKCAIWLAPLNRKSKNP